MRGALFISLLFPVVLSGQGWFLKSFDTTPSNYPDSVFIEGEHFSLNGLASKAYRFGYSNDTAVGNLNTNSSNYIYKTLSTPHDSIYVVAKVNTAGTMVDVLLNDLVVVNDYVIPTTGNPIGFGVPISINPMDVIRIRAVSNFIEIDYVIFYNQIEE